MQLSARRVCNSDRQIENKINDIWRPSTAKDINRFGKFQCVTNGPSEWLVHWRKKIRNLQTHCLTNAQHGIAEYPELVELCPNPWVTQGGKVGQ